MPGTIRGGKEGARGAPLGRLRQKLQVLLPNLEILSWPEVLFPRRLSREQPHGLNVVLENRQQHRVNTALGQRAILFRVSCPVLRTHVPRAGEPRGAPPARPA